MITLTGKDLTSETAVVSQDDLDRLDVLEFEIVKNGDVPPPEYHQLLIRCGIDNEKARQRLHVTSKRWATFNRRQSEIELMIKRADLDQELLELEKETAAKIKEAEDAVRSEYAVKFQKLKEKRKALGEYRQKSSDRDFLARSCSNPKLRQREREYKARLQELRLQRSELTELANPAYQRGAG